jgi:hypothetical protein
MVRRLILVDQTTLIVISTVVQTIVISLTLVIFTLSFRSQEKATRESAYQGLIGRYNDLIATIADKPEVIQIMMGGASRGKPVELSKEDAAIYAHLIHAYGIIEEAYILRQKKWIDEENWQQWAAFLKGLSKLPLFAPMCERTRGTFDPGFETWVAGVLKDSKETARS